MSARSIGLRGEAGAVVGLFRVMSADLEQIYFPGGFHDRESAELWALKAMIRGDIPDGWRVIRL